MSQNSQDSLDEKLAIAIHNIRNPLNTISMNAELAMISLRTNLDIKKQERLLNTILQECEACSARLDDFHKLSTRK